MNEKSYGIPMRVSIIRVVCDDPSHAGRVTKIAAFSSDPTYPDEGWEPPAGFMPVGGDGGEGVRYGRWSLRCDLCGRHVPLRQSRLDEVFDRAWEHREQLPGWAPDTRTLTLTLTGLAAVLA